MSQLLLIKIFSQHTYIYINIILPLQIEFWHGRTYLFIVLKKNFTIMHKYFMHIHILNSSYQASVAYYYYYSIFFRRIGNILYKIIKYNCSLYFRKKCNSPDLETYFLFNQKKISSSFRNLLNLIPIMNKCEPRRDDCIFYWLLIFTVQYPIQCDILLLAVMYSHSLMQW